MTLTGNRTNEIIKFTTPLCSELWCRTIIHPMN